ncbi:peptidoglycan D,D-transpeptidase FtsI family protein [Paenibacillus sp. 1001270B_150601_E10]|uniref:peptidoglycan D,D-transpeptidase FtsI family protein n=1 Tax=Paenibacillus sp. 1001270B_150601_E10 TaxID=2787079 RepID=UPI0018A0CAC0|nr:penicillin-binding protein 2 [Paenibacillus sp. 1001270B_150601_E10]
MSMLQHETEEHVINRKKKLSMRTSIFFFAVFLVFVILVVRLAILQFVEGASLKAKAQDIGQNPTYIASIRGSIYDAANQRIAYSTPTQSLYFRIQKQYKEEEVQELAKRLKEVLDTYGDKKKSMSVAEIVKKLDVEGRRTFGYLPRQIKIDLTKHEIAYFLEHKQEFPGFEVLEEGIRQYDPTPFAPQLVGYLGRYGGLDMERYPYYKKLKNSPETENTYLDTESVGVAGLEYMYEGVLKGENGKKTYIVDSLGRIVGDGDFEKPVKGNNIHLTIHPIIQKRTQQKIEQHLEKLQHSSLRSERAPNAKTGYAVAMEVKTGNVITMANVPQYDPNIWRNGITEKQLREIGSNMNNGTITEVFQDYGDKKENNRHPSSLVYLGSTVKPLTVLIGLQEKLITTDTYYQDIGYAVIGRKGSETPIANSDSHAYGRMDPATAIAKSSNAFMIDMIGNPLYMKYGKEKGLEIWDRYMKAFGLGSDTGSGLPRESQGVLDYMQEGQTGQAALAYASFGQQGKYTTLQLAQYAATLANHGKRLKPQFVTHITDSKGNTIQEVKPEVVSEIKFEDRYWKEVEDGMKRVNMHGFEDAAYEVVRKTGTSQQWVSGGIVENAVFIAYAPAKDPKLAVAVVVPEGGFGAYGAAPIAREIFDSYFEIYGK